MLATLRHLVTLKKPVQTSDNQGSWTTAYPVGEWVAVPAAVQPLSGTERATYRQIDSAVTTKIIVRFGESTEEITNKWRIGFRGVDYDIESVIEPAARGRFLTLLVKERR